MLLGRETLEDHSQLQKRLTNAALGQLQAFGMYGGIGMSASSLHRESTNSDKTVGEEYSTYSSIDPPWRGAQYIESIKHSIEIRGLLQERVMLVDICHTSHDGHWGEGKKEGEEGGREGRRGRREGGREGGKEGEGRKGRDEDRDKGEMEIGRHDSWAEEEGEREMSGFIVPGLTKYPPSLTWLQGRGGISIGLSSAASRK